MTKFQMTMKAEKNIAKLLGKDRIMVNFQEYSMIGDSFFMIKADGRWFDCDFDGSAVVAE
jgi:hypothetical protein